MDTKLTLKLNSRVISRAKLFAKNNHTSLSRLIENYLGMLDNSQDKEEITPLVKSLSGLLDLPEDYDFKKKYKQHLVKKYTK